MELREKVIKGLECCLPMTTRDGVGDCKNCPYDRKITLEGGITECCHELLADALELAKIQELVEPIKGEDNYIRCGKCKHRIVGIVAQDTGDMIPCAEYCPGCGQAVKWDGN